MPWRRRILSSLALLALTGHDRARAPLLEWMEREVNSFSRFYVSGFAAVMTCSHADKACPLVYGASARFSTPYVDPKVSDGTPEERDTYDERCAQIAREMLYAMSRAGA